ncbi:hypothetical protein ElyMa_004043700 [Elysia marginata]|uniref:Reverse transcriptase domain-containing protein n=1 Tax=Elysia marginata TaxID=1093978 RepID=A0AAV4G474_9GAST|nr:hypothetical protein ElyMa_004043700 [Elysia marginata]
MELGSGQNYLYVSSSAFRLLSRAPSRSSCGTRTGNDPNLNTLVHQRTDLGDFIDEGWRKFREPAGGDQKVERVARPVHRYEVRIHEPGPLTDAQVTRGNRRSAQSFDGGIAQAVPVASFHTFCDALAIE